MSEPFYLSTEEVLDLVAPDAVGHRPDIRDFGLLDAAVNRARASVFGRDAYPDLWSKAAAMLHSIATNHPLVDGNKRLAWHTAVVFLAVNGATVVVDDDTAYDLVIAVSTGELDDVGKIAERLETFGA
ncbi:MAG TPA: type II toxin-antitoxin system death-on-curing family toxin [Cryptosporangiaceae bacterium]|nr:type II toxin-antitoxin system death-on-curing family toxin [Cryptosporangiaceae bacterium]